MVAFHKGMVGSHLISGLFLYFSFRSFMLCCTKQIFLLYKRINCFVQKNAFFCTRKDKYPE